jgi:tetratricopeptide (TPR) repeat protein
MHGMPARAGVKRGGALEAGGNSLMIRRALSIVFGVLISTVGEITAVTGQTLPEPVKVSPPGVKAGPAADISFYLARGEADACGRACSEWIAAEGRIDPGAAQRLRRLLAKLGHRRLPIFFHSPGGSVAGSLELGRLIRGQKLVASVARTIPRGCDRDNLQDKTCEELKRSGMEIESEFDAVVTMCNSGCVYALIGGTTHLVPPWVKLGIHEVGLGPEKKAALRGAPITDVKRAAHARILEYVLDMGVDKALLTAASAVPNESVRFLERDDLVRFGIDRREFGESVWRFADKPTVSMSKRVFFRTGSGDQPRYRKGLVRLDCGTGQAIRLLFAQEQDSSEHKSTDPLQLDVNGQRINLRHQSWSSEFDWHSASLSMDMLDVIGRGPNITVSGIDQGRNDGTPGSVTLSMDGFSGGSAKLRQSCNESASNAIALVPRTGSVTSTSVTRPQPSSLGTNASTYDQAIADYNEKIRLNPNRADLFNSRGVAYYRKGDYNSAITDYAEAIRLHPENAVFYNSRGIAYRRMGDYDRAIADYTEAIRLDSKYAVAYNNRGFSYNNKGDYDRAVADLNEAIRLNPNYAIAYVNRGAAYSDNGDKDNAIADFDEAIRINPNYVQAYRLRGSIYSLRNDYSRALADLDEAIRLDSKSATSYALRGGVYSRSGDHDKGMADCNEAIRLDPKSPNAYNSRGFVYNNKGDFARAIVDLNEAIRINPNYAFAYKNRAVSFEGRNELEKALADYNAALKLRPRLLEAAEGAKRVSQSLAEHRDRD